MWKAEFSRCLYAGHYSGIPHTLFKTKYILISGTEKPWPAGRVALGLGEVWRPFKLVVMRVCKHPSQAPVKPLSTLTMGKAGFGLVWEEHHSIEAVMWVQAMLLGCPTLPQTTASLRAEFPR